MYLGRGDFDTSDLAAEYQTIREDFDKPSAVIAEMMEKAALGEYLQEGMTILKTQQINLDKLALPAKRVGK
jgi:hypothetical protein